MAIVTRWDGDSDANKRDTLSFARDFAQWLLRDARRGSNRTTEAQASSLATMATGANTDATQSQIDAWATGAVNVRNALASRGEVYSCPPLFVAVPAVTESANEEGWNDAGGDPDTLATLAQQAQGLPAGDNLRNAINQWSAWWDGITVATTDERERAAGLASWASAQLSNRLAALQTETPPPPGPTPSRRGGNTGAALLAVVIALALGGRKRRR